MIPGPGHLAPALVLLAAAFAELPVAGAAERSFSFGPVAGGSLLSSTHRYSGAPKIYQEITLRPTLLFGATADLRLAPHDHLSMEPVVGPYRGDFETTFIFRGRLSCDVETKRVKVGGHLEVRYLRTFGDSQWRPLAGTGIGLKGYAYRNGDDFEDRSGLTSTLGVGVERSGRKTVRAEIRGVLVWHNPLFFSTGFNPSPRTYELHARIGVLFPK